MSDLVATIRERYLRTLDQIATVAQKSNRDPNTIRLVVVTKTQPLEIIQAAIDAGITTFGENYPEEGVMKIQSLQYQGGLEWHMIGHVQSRKAALIPNHFALLHSLDSLKLAQRLNRFAVEQNCTLPVLLEFNVGGEQTKSGWDASSIENWEAFLPDIHSVLELKNLRVRGLMTMPPLESDMENARRYFRQLRLLRDQLALTHLETDWHELSMGTSSDYLIAIEEGATIVRVGTAIVGERRYKPEQEPA